MRWLALFVLAPVLLWTGCGRSASVYMERGKRQAAENNHAEAALSFRRAIQADPNSGPAHKALGEAALKQGELAEALQAYSSSIEILTGDVEAHEKLADILLGAYLTNSRRPAYLRDRLLGLAKKIESLNPRSVEVWRVRGMVAGTDGKASEALECFRKANAIPPLRPGLKLLELQARLDSGDAAGSEAAALELLQARPDFTAGYDWLLRAYQQRRDRKSAEQLILRKMEANPNEISTYLQLARFYNQLGNTGAAESIITQSMTKLPAEESSIAIGDYYLSLGNAPQAGIHYRKAISLPPPASLRARKRLAVSLGAQRKFADGIAEVAEVRKLDPRDIEAVRIEADLRARSGQPRDLEIAASIFRELILRSSADLGAHFGLAAVLLAKGDSKSAREELRRCVSLNPHHRPAILTLASLYRSEGDYRSLVLLADSVLHADPRDDYAKLLRAEGFVGEKRLGEARAGLLALLKNSPVSREATLLLARVYMMERNLAAAEQLLRPVVVGPNVDLLAYNTLSDVLVAQGRKSEVVTLWKNACDRKPGSPPLQRGLAKAIYMAGDYTRAISECRALLDSDPSDHDALILLAASVYSSGSRQEGLALFRKASDMKGANLALLEGIMAYLYQMDKNGPVAEVYYRRILARDPNNHSALNNLAYLLAEKEDALAEAEQLANRALALSHENVHYKDTLAFVRQKAGKAPTPTAR